MTKRNINIDLACFIYNIILASGKSHQQIADEIGVELRTINYYCSGQRKPSQINLLKLLKVTKANTTEIPF